jgi:hypothetical protein
VASMSNKRTIKRLQKRYEQMDENEAMLAWEFESRCNIDAVLLILYYIEH